MLPFARRLLSRDGRRDAPVVGRHVVPVDGLSEAVDDLALVASTQVHAGVRALRNAHVVAKAEVVEVGALRPEVRAAASPASVWLEAKLVGTPISR